MTAFYVKDPESPKNEYHEFKSIEEARACAANIISNSYWSSVDIFVGAGKGLLLGTVSKDRGGFKWISSNTTHLMDFDGTLT